ncbi:DUF6122 family protein [Hymenobacter metallilatus]|jgi:Family of unknown function (DUF6122)|uniref:Metal-dependent hydrolase n=1 Tax=Hymenobacter metallilatus TaxID=2493666 RepID=A0A3R9NZ85_9BACT|nr:DUF6122 family protein [Hymenobacter metallilatus]RSK24535.1 hypothetical protein EI290_19485 [Hymenobacter metallilatus]
MVHALLHLLVPGIVALLFYRPRWRRAWLILATALLLDIDHVLATPMFDPTRCSINYHPLHTYWAMGIYGFVLLPPITRPWAVGFLLHMALDYAECWQLGIRWPQ